MAKDTPEGGWGEIEPGLGVAVRAAAGEQRDRDERHGHRQRPADDEQPYRHRQLVALAEGVGLGRIAEPGESGDAGE